MVNEQLHQSEQDTPVFLSIILPVYNEEENVPIVYAQLHAVVATLDRLRGSASRWNERAFRATDTGQ